MAISKEEMLDAIANMTVLEISELVKAMEEKFGVSAAVPVAAVAAAPAGGADGGDGAEEKNAFDVVLTTVVNKIAVIKVVKTITGLGLKEAKELVETDGATVKPAVPKAEAEEMKKQIEEAGATVELK